MLASAHRVLATLDEPAIMGILNVTPDSFSDGGKFICPKTQKIDRNKGQLNGDFV